MLDSLAHSPPAMKLIRYASQIVGFDIEKMCRDNPDNILDETEYCQVVVFVVSLATLEIFKQAYPHAYARTVGFAGLSLGQFTALVAAGALSFPDGLELVRTRGRAMQAAAEAAQGAAVM